MTSLIILKSLLQVVNSFVQTLLTNCNKPCEHNLVDGFFADLLQVVRFLRVYRFDS